MELAQASVTRLRHGLLRNLVPGMLLLLVGLLVVAPLLKITFVTLTPEGLEAWQACGGVR